MPRSISDPTNTQRLDPATETPSLANEAGQPVAGLATQATADPPGATPLADRSATASPPTSSRAEIAAQVIDIFDDRLKSGQLPPAAGKFAGKYLEALRDALEETHRESPNLYSLYLHSTVLPVLTDTLLQVLENVDDAATQILLDDMAWAGRRLAEALPACVAYLQTGADALQDPRAAAEAERTLFLAPLAEIEMIARGNADPLQAPAVVPLTTQSSKSTPAA